MSARETIRPYLTRNANIWTIAKPFPAVRPVFGRFESPIGTLVCWRSYICRQSSLSKILSTENRRERRSVGQYAGRTGMAQRPRIVTTTTKDSSGTTDENRSGFQPHSWPKLPWSTSVISG